MVATHDVTNEARDPHGRWTAGGAHASAAPPVEAYVARKAPRQAYVARVTGLLPGGLDTDSLPRSGDQWDIPLDEGAIYQYAHLPAWGDRGFWLVRGGKRVDIDYAQALKLAPQPAVPAGVSLPALQGTPKQVAWAEQIRAARYGEAATAQRDYAAQLGDMVAAGHLDAAESTRWQVELQGQVDRLFSGRTAAQDWIDTKDNTFGSLLSRPVPGYLQPAATAKPSAGTRITGFTRPSGGEQLVPGDPNKGVSLTFGGGSQGWIDVTTPSGHRWGYNPVQNRWSYGKPPSADPAVVKQITDAVHTWQHPPKAPALTDTGLLQWTLQGGSNWEATAPSGNVYHTHYGWPMNGVVVQRNGELATEAFPDTDAGRTAAFASAQRQAQTPLLWRHDTHTQEYRATDADGDWKVAGRRAGELSLFREFSSPADHAWKAEDAAKHYAERIEGGQAAATSRALPVLPPVPAGAQWHWNPVPHVQEWHAVNPQGDPVHVRMLTPRRGQKPPSFFVLTQQMGNGGLFMNRSGGDFPTLAEALSSAEGHPIPAPVPAAPTPAAPPVPLQWAQQNAVTQTAGDFTVRRNSKSGKYTLMHGGTVLGTHDTRVDAKAAAQALHAGGVVPAAPAPALPQWTQQNAVTWTLRHGDADWTIKRNSKTKTYSLQRDGQSTDVFPNRQAAMAHVYAQGLTQGPS